MFNARKIKKDFPIFTNHPELVYLDSTATSLKPQQVIDKENEYYTKYTANIFRGIYKISEKATAEYEGVRQKVAQLIGAKNALEIVFTRNTTESINLVVHGLENEISPEHEILVSIAEHHSNFVPWQQLAKRKKAKFHAVDIDEKGLIKEKYLLSLINDATKVVGLFHISNVLGTINPLKEIIAKIKMINPKCIVVVDGAQAVPHLEVNVVDLGCDFYAFSSHKMLGPTGVGVLWGKYELLEKIPPYQMGGEMIESVYLDHTNFKKPPYRFEAGTPHIAGVIGLGVAIDYLQKLGMKNIRNHEIELTRYAQKKLNKIEGLKIVGPQDPEKRSGVIAFTMNEAHAHDIAQVLDSDNICIRAGHHCAMPLHLYLNISSTARASFYIYTTKEDVDKLIKGLEKVLKLFN